MQSVWNYICKYSDLNDQYEVISTARIDLTVIHYADGLAWPLLLSNTYNSNKD